MRVVIIGAGPTGLGAARELERAGADWRLIEEQPWAGGLSASCLANGYTWDIGGHILFSHYDEFDRMLEELFTTDEWLTHARQTYIRLGDGWIPYPFQNNIHRLPPAERDRCIADLEAAARAPAVPPPRNFEELMLRCMGAGLARLFLLPYNNKVWAHPPALLATAWIGDRVAMPDPARIRRQMAAARDDVAWGPNAVFRFPVRGGTGAIWRRMAARLPRERLRFSTRVRSVDLGAHRVHCEDGSSHGYDALVSTAPVDRLIAMAGATDLAGAAGLLRHSATHVFGFGFRGSLPSAAADKCWMYFPEPHFPFYRVTVFSRYSADNAPPGHYSLMAEVASSAQCPVKEDGLAERCLAGLVRAGLAQAGNPPACRWQTRVEYGYPVPTLERDQALRFIHDALEKRAVFSRGRFGAWLYEVANMDHSCMQGVEIARRLTQGIEERTVRYPAEVNRARPKAGNL